MHLCYSLFMSIYTVSRDLFVDKLWKKEMSIQYMYYCIWHFYKGPYNIRTSEGLLLHYILMHFQVHILNVFGNFQWAHLWIYCHKRVLFTLYYSVCQFDLGQ